MEVKRYLKRNRWHFCENIGNDWNRVRPALQCLDITCLYILSFRLKDFSQTEQNKLMSTLQEQNVDWERGRMLSIYIGLQAIKFQCFLPPPPPPHSVLFSLHHHHHHHRHHHISTFTSPSLIQLEHISIPKKISGYCYHIRTLYLTWPDRMSLTKQRSESLYKRLVVLLKMY